MIIDCCEETRSFLYQYDMDLKRETDRALLNTNSNPLVFDLLAQKAVESYFANIFNDELSKILVDNRDVEVEKSQIEGILELTKTKTTKFFNELVIKHIETIKACVLKL